MRIRKEPEPEPAAELDAAQNLRRVELALLADMTTMEGRRTELEQARDEYRRAYNKPAPGQWDGPIWNAIDAIRRGLPRARPDLYDGPPRASRRRRDYETAEADLAHGESLLTQRQALLAQLMTARGGISDNNDARRIMGMLEADVANVKRQRDTVRAALQALGDERTVTDLARWADLQAMDEPSVTVSV